LSSIAENLGHTEIDVLKMDIEGTEYEVIDSILQSGIVVKQWLLEFHHRLFPDGVTRTQKALQQLQKADFGLFAVSDSFQELSFINKNYMIM
jgi:hypothetical protein